MAFASGSEVRVAHVAETAFGVTPATPTFKTARVTTGGGRTNKQTAVSDERQPDRNTRDVLLLGLGAGGNYGAELSYGTFDDWLAAVLCGEWATDVLKNGTTRKSFTLEETLELGGTDSFFRFPGAMLNTMSMTVNAREKIGLTFDWLAKQEVAANAIVTGATYTPANTKEIMTATKSVADLTLSTGSAKVRQLSLQVSNNLRERPVVGSGYSEEFGLGRFAVTGTLQAYFESNALYEASIAHGSGSLSFTVGEMANEKYSILLPKIRFGDAERQTGGRDDDVMVSLPFTAIYDATEACSIKITRAVA